MEDGDVIDAHLEQVSLDSCPVVGFAHVFISIVLGRWWPLTMSSLTASEIILCHVTFVNFPTYSWPSVCFELFTCEVTRHAREPCMIILYFCLVAYICPFPLIVGHPRSLPLLL